MTTAWRLLLGVLAVTAADARAAEPAPLAIVGATLVDGTGAAPVPDAVVLIEAGRIRAAGPRSQVAVPEGARVLDARGKFLVPGLVDAHGHLSRGTLTPPEPPERLLEDLLRWGVTSVLNTHSDMASFSRARDLGRDDAAPAPRFYGVGRLITAPGGWGAVQGGYLVTTAAEARSAVQELKSAGVDAVKLVYDDMSWLTSRALVVLSPAALSAAVDEAHAHGLKALVHAPILATAKQALKAGADALVHGIVSDPVDDELIGLMKARNAVYVATLGMFQACADAGPWSARLEAFDDAGRYPPAAYEALREPGFLRGWHGFWDRSVHVKGGLPVLRENLKRLHAAGVAVATGTDTGVPGVLLGISHHMELQLHVEAGLSPAAALRASTLDAARLLGQERELGSIEPGKRADLLILDADPLADIGHTRRLHRVVKGGAVFEPVARAVEPAAEEK